MTKNEKIEEVYFLSWQIFLLIKIFWDETDDQEKEKQWDKYLNLRVDLWKKVKEIPDIDDNISYYDTNEFFYGLETRTKKDYKKISYEDFKKYVDEYLIGKPFVFEFCFRYGKSHVFPSGYKLGYGIMYPFDDLPKSVKKRVEWSMRVDFHDDNEYKKT